MKKILIMLLVFGWVLFAEEIAKEIVATGKRVTAECKKIANQKLFEYGEWAGACPGDTIEELEDFLYRHKIAERVLPPCKEPEGVELGEFIDGNVTVPDGYELVEENITGSRRYYYKAYGLYSRDGADFGSAITWVRDGVFGKGVRVNVKVLNKPNCRLMALGFDFKADVYAGVIEEEYFKRVYKKSCTTLDRDYPVLADNEEILFSWSDGNRSQECIEDGGVVESKVINCKSEYRCVRELRSCQIEDLEYVNSYVNPRDRSFSEEVELVGVDFALNYSSKRELNFGFGRGWSLSNLAYYDKNSSLIYFGSGAVWRVDSNKIDNNSFVLNGIEYQFNSRGGIESIKDVYTKSPIWSFEYDSSNKLSKIIDKDNKETIVIRDGNKIEVIAPFGQISTLYLDSKDNLESVEYEDGSSYGFEYEDNSSLMIKEITPRGEESIHTFDEFGKVKEVIDTKGAVWKFEVNGTIKRVLKPIDTILYQSYPLNGDILSSKKVLPSGDTVKRSLFIDEDKQEIESCGVIASYEYEEDNISNSKILKSSTITTPSGLRKRENKEVDYIFDGDRVKEKIIKRSIGEKEFETRVDYEQKRLKYITPLGRVVEINFDDKMSHILSIKSPYQYRINYSYDSFGRVVKSTQDSRVFEYSYDSRGNLASIKDPIGRVTTYEYDIRDRVVKINYPDGGVVGFEYDKEGNLVALTTPTPTTHTFEYDSLNLPIDYKSAMQKILSYEYDKQRRVTKIIKPSRKEINFNYQDGRLSSVVAEDKETTLSYSCQSLISKIKREDEEINYSYDGSLLKSITQKGILNQTVEIEYNSLLLPKEISYAKERFEIGYNDDLELSKVGRFEIKRAKGGELDINISDNNYRLSSHYNLFGQLDKKDDGVFGLELEYNSVGEITKKVEKIKFQSPMRVGFGGFFRSFLPKKKVTFEYEYDDRGRLTKVKRGRKVVEEYSYDSNGNRVEAKLRYKIFTKSYKAEYNQDDQLIRYGDREYSYDEDGYLAQIKSSDGNTTYEYGVFGELKRVVTPNKTIEYLHNANHQRVAKKVDGEITEKYLWLNLTTLLAIYDKDDNLVWRFEYGGERLPISMVDRDGNRYYLHYDQVGSLRAVSDKDGNIIKTITYDTFGNIIDETNKDFKVPFGFAGGLYDSDTGLVRFGFRDYDPFTGRWTAKDPILFNGGDTNLYGYVLGDPVSFVDPEGEKVYLCKTPVNGITIVDHYWIKTDAFERGMWNEDDIDQWYDNIPFFAQVAVRDEPYHPEALCKEIPYVDENLVNDQLTLYRDLGTWTPWNNCQTFATEVLSKATIIDPFYLKIMGYNLDIWVKRSSIK